MQTGGFSDFAKTCLAEQLDCTDCQAVNSDCIDCDSDSDDWWKIRQVAWYAYVCSMPVWVGASTDRKRFNTSCKRLRRTTSSCNVLQVFHSDRHQTVLQRIQPGHTFLQCTPSVSLRLPSDSTTTYTTRSHFPSMYSKCFTPTAIRQYYNVYNQVTLSFVMCSWLLLFSCWCRCYLIHLFVTAASILKCKSVLTI